VRNDHVEDQIGVTLSAHHAEIVDGELGVDLPQRAEHQRLRLVELLVVRDDRVVVDDELHVELPLDLVLDVVDDLVALQHVLAAVHLDVDARKAAAGAVVVDDEVVDAQHFVVREHLARDRVDEFLVRRLAQKRVDRVLGDADAAV